MVGREPFVLTAGSSSFREVWEASPTQKGSRPCPALQLFCRVAETLELFRDKGMFRKGSSATLARVVKEGDSTAQLLYRGEKKHLALERPNWKEIGGLMLTLLSEAAEEAHEATITCAILCVTQNNKKGCGDLRAGTEVV